MLPILLKNFLLSALLVFPFAQAQSLNLNALNVNDLPKLISNPAAYKPAIKSVQPYDDFALDAIMWEWDKNKLPALILTTTKVPNAWNIQFEGKFFPLKKTFPNIRKVAQMHIKEYKKELDRAADDKEDYYIITSGPLKGNYIFLKPSEPARDDDSYTLMSPLLDKKRYFSKKGVSADSSAPIAGYVYNKAVFCKREFIKCF